MDKQSGTVGHMLPKGIISLTTDFGADDPYVGIKKGVILGYFPAARIVDLTHRVPAYRPEVAGLLPGLSCGWFPCASLHLAVVDPGWERTGTLPCC